MLAISCLFQFLAAQQSAKPVNYWTFNSSNPLADSIENKNPLKVVGEPIYAKGMVGNALSLRTATSLSSSKPLMTAASGMTKALTVSFVYQVEMQPQNLSILYLIMNNSFQLVMLPQAIRWNTFHADKTKHTWDIPLTGTGRNNPNFLLDHHFHHWVFTFDSQKGQKQLWIDGLLMAEESAAKELKTPLVAEGITYLQRAQEEGKNLGKWDEVAFYNFALSPNLIRKQWVEAQQGHAFSFVETGTFAENHAAIQKAIPAQTYDIKEFAQGHPNVTQLSVPQLQSYPAPRYKPFHALHRNLVWQGITYYDKKEHSEELVNIYIELAKNWNYYYLVTTNVFFPPQKGQIEAANENPWFPLQINSYWGFANAQYYHPTWKKTSYILSDNLPKSAYLTDKNGQYLTGKPVWSPASGLDSIRKDGILARLAFEKNVAPLLKRPIDIIGENGEVFGTIYKDSILAQDPKVVKDKQLHFPDWDWLSYQSYRRYQADSAYRAELMSAKYLQHAQYLYYLVNGEHAGSTFQYKYIRKVHTPLRNSYYATHSFYPVPHNAWATTLGWRKGWNYTMQARNIELALGDKWCSPYIATGFSGDEEKNMRPGRWLGLMKALAGTGAEFYNAFFYTGSDKSDPKNYIWNTVIPSYAQAITSRYTDVFWQGNVLAGDMKNPEDYLKTPTYRFWTGNPNHLVVVRKHESKEKYVIIGTIQPQQLSPDAMPRTEVVSISLAGETLTFEIRQQGSTYIYDKSEGKTVFYQLDKWHQYEHISWWSKNIAMEAEVMDSVMGGNVQILTERLGKVKDGDFSAFTSYIQATKGCKIAYFFQPRNIPEQSQFSLKVRARVKEGGSASLALNYEANSMDYKQPKVYTGKKAQSNEILVSGSEWKWYNIDSKTKAAIIFKGFLPDTPQTLWLLPSSDKIEIDELVLEANP